MVQPSRRKSILVVDDNPEIAQVVQDVLASYGYQVAAVDDIAALQASREYLPDLILLDLVMPHVSGVDAARRLTELPETADIPIVLMSGVKDLAQCAAQVGAAAYLSKPFDLDELLNTVEAVLGTVGYAPSQCGGRKFPHEPHAAHQ